MTPEQNELMTRVGSSAPGGALLRMYWQPAALTEELQGPRAIVPVRLLGEDFVLFRNPSGEHGLLDRDCPHRGADLAFGRLEKGGLRCAFHGWLFNVDGTCLETPAEPVESRLCTRIRQRAFPVIERSGILWAYLGKGEPPPFPDLDCFLAPDAYTFAFKGRLECNWLQALEVGIDPAHASFLHRFFEDESTNDAYGRQFRGASAGSEMPMTKILREYAQPTISVKKTDFGMRLCALREIDTDKTHVRVTNLLFPQAFVIPLSADMTITQWHVPVDDVTSYWYAIFTSFTTAVDKETMRAQRLELYEPPEYRPRRNKNNNYGFDAQEHAHQTYTGMGFDINVHDQWAVESLGRIQDRTREHLGQTDKGIVLFRLMLLDALKGMASGTRPPMVLDTAQAKAIRGPMTLDGIGPKTDWQAHWSRREVERRRQAPWGAPALPDMLVNLQE